MKLHELYAGIEFRLDRLDFDSLWKEFGRAKFALYDDERCFFDGRYIDKPAGFAGNTAIRFNGEYVAIWHIDDAPQDMDGLAAAIVHEMFHAFQMESGESRWADELAALFDYRYLPRNISIKLHEAALMRDIIISGKGAATGELLALRKARALLYPYEYDYEARIEQIEGCASCVEATALSQLNAQKGALLWQSMLDSMGDVRAYAPVRRVSYCTGAAFLRCMSEYTDMDCCEFGSVPLAQRSIAQAPRMERLPVLEPAAAERAAEYTAETASMVEAALSRGDVVLRGEHELISLNVYDARWDGRHAVSHSFVAYLDGEEPKVLRGDFVLELGRDRVMRTVYRM